MKYSKIVILFALVIISVFSFLLLLLFFQVPICELTKNVFTSIMISCIVAIPSVIILLYNSFNSTNQNISELYLKIFLIVRDDIPQISELNKKGINEIKDKLVTISQDIGKLREDTKFNRKYDNDKLTNYISELVNLIRKYIEETTKKQKYLKQINGEAKKILQHICDIEGISNN